MALTNNQTVLDWIDEMAAMTQPEHIVWIDGSDAQMEELRAQACATGELEKLNQEKLPGCYLHRTAANDVARVEGRTFICCRKQEDAGPTNNWMAPEEMYARLRRLYTGAMKGRTMYVIPYSMGVVGSPFAKYGIELTEENHKQFYIPQGFAHGFLVLSDIAEFCYKCTDFYHPGDEGGMAWNDPEIGITWPQLAGTYQGSASAEGYTLSDGTPLNLSDKDQKWVGLKDTFHF